MGVRKDFLIPSPYGISLSFNGGKDCTAVLFIYLAVLEKYFKENPQQHPRPVRCLYITSVDPFVQVDEFVDYCASTYNLTLTQKVRFEH
jgi:FAD synthetase